MAGYIGNRAVGLNVTTGNILGNVAAGGDVSVGDDLTVTDDAAIGGDLEVTGKIGIGATGSNIDANLHVVGTALVGTAAANTTIDDSLSTGLDVVVGSGTKAFQVWDDNNTSTPRFSVLRNGLVGITTTPLSGLHISDGTNAGSPQNANRAATLMIDAGATASADIQFMVRNGLHSHIFFGDAADPNVGVLYYDHTANDMVINTNAAECARFISEGGITFNGDTAAANALNDYEEGTWRPVVHSGSTAVTLEHQDTVQGVYTKIGRLVTLHMEIDVNNMNSATGLINITGLPFAVTNNIAPTGIEANGSVAYFAGWATSVFTVGIYAAAGSGLLNMTMQTAAQQAVLDVNGDDIGTGEFRASITYFSG